MFKQFSWLLIGRLGAAAVQFVTFLLLARWAGPADFGFVAAIVAFMIIPQAVLDFGIATAVLKERALSPESTFTLSALRLSNRISLLFGGVSILIALALGLLADPRFLGLVPLAISAPAEKNSDTWMSVVVADGDTWINSVNLAGRRLGHLLLFVALVPFLHLPVIFGYSLAAALASLVSAAFAQSLLGRRLPGSDEKVGLRGIFHSTRSFWVHSVATQARNVDGTLVALINSTVEAGYYSVASRLAGPLRMVPTTLAPVLLARVARYGFDTAARRAAILAAGSMSILYLAIALAAPWIVALALGPQYQGSILPVQIVSVSLIFGAVASLLAAVLQGLGEQRRVAQISVATSLIAVAGISGLTALWQASGAALGLGLSFLFQACSLMVALRKGETQPRGVADPRVEE